MTKDEIKDAVCEAIDEKLSQFWIDRETHHEHHKAIGKWIEWVDDANKTIRRTLIKVIIIGIIGLMALGALIKFRGHE